MESATCLHPVTILSSSPYSLTKKPFLLLEILISILIVSLCLIPLVQGPIFAYREEIYALEEMERERISEWSFSEVKEKLLNREIPWDRLPVKGEKSFPFSLPSKTLELPSIKKRKIERSFTLQCTGEHEDKKGTLSRMYKVEIILTPPLKRGPKKSTYKVMIQKKHHTKES